MNKVIFVLVFVAVGYVAASPAAQCQGERTENLKERIHVEPCGSKKCKLIKGTNTTTTFRFQTKKAVPSLINNVQAQILGIPLPFIGVDGTSACNNIVNAEDNTPAKCPLEAGKEYVYVKTVFVEPLYPVVQQLIVHWDLRSGEESIICFEIPASINEKKGRA